MSAYEVREWSDFAVALVGAAAALYWLPAAVVLALLAGLATAWVLLAEILR